ncbi:MAG TPA: hypothetical protein VF322_10935 [Gammaproteobacteria bacterium]
MRGPPHKARARGGRAARCAAAAALLLAAGASGAQTTAEPQGEEIEWRPDRKLAWSDFRGPVDPEASRGVAAVTMVSLEFGYGYAIERSAGLCGYRITEIASAAVFHPEASWVRPEAATDATLAHEQGHFDLTQVHKLEFEAATRPLLDVRYTCRYAGAIEQDLLRRVDPVREDVEQRLEALQAQYDVETGRGTIAAKQREWSERIAAALQRGRWE